MVSQYGSVPQWIIEALWKETQKLRLQGLNDSQIVQSLQKTIGFPALGNLRNMYLQNTGNIQPSTNYKITPKPANNTANNYNFFGQEAIQQEQQSPGYMEKRNQDIANAINNNPNLSYDNTDQLLQDELKKRTGGKDLWSFGVWEDQRKNTIQSIKWLIKPKQYDFYWAASDTNYMPDWYTPIEVPDLQAQYEENLKNLQNQWSIAQKDIIDQYQKIFGENKLIEDQVKNQYGNWDEVKNNIDAVTKQYQQWIEDPNQIAQNTGVNIDKVNQIIQGKAFNDLQLSDEYQNEQLSPFRKAIDDLKLWQQRNIEDLDLRTQRVNDQFVATMENLKKQYDQQYQWNIREGVATWSVRSALFNKNIDNLTQNFGKMMEELKYNKNNDLHDTTVMKNRMLEDFERNFQEVNKKMQDQTKNLKIDGLSKLQAIQQKYWSNVVDMKDALDKLNESIDEQHLKINEQYTKQISDIQEQKREELKYLQEYKQKIFDNQQKVVWELTKDNGMALVWVSLWDLQKMVATGYLSPEWATQLQWYMSWLTTSTLSQLWKVTAADTAKVNNLLSQWKTPQEIISSFQESGKFSWATDKELDFVSATKYQPAGYFNKKTWEFTPVGGGGVSWTSWKWGWVKWTWTVWGGKTQWSAQWSAQGGIDINPYVNFIAWTESMTKANMKSFMDAINSAKTDSQKLWIVYKRIKNKLTTEQVKSIDAGEALTDWVSKALWVLSTLSKIDTWIVDKTLRNIRNFTWLSSEEDKKQKEFLSTLSNVTAQYRNNLFGASLTPGEQSAALEFLPSEDDSIPTIKAKIQWLLIVSGWIKKRIIDREVFDAPSDFTPVINAARAKVESSFASSSWWTKKGTTTTSTPSSASTSLADKLKQLYWRKK